MMRIADFGLRIADWPRAALAMRLEQFVIPNPRCAIRSVAAVVLVAACVAAEDGTEILYRNDFEKEEVGKEARDLGFVVMGDGDFRIKLDGQNKVLELTPYPLDSYGFLFGPAATEDLCVRLRVWGAAAGRRFPVFAAGMGGVGGYMLRLTPIRKTLELLKADEVKQSVSYTWASGTWTMLALSVRKLKDGAWSVQGKAWEYGKDEPKDWLVSFEDTEKPPSGKAGAWGAAYSGEPIRFDDLVVQRSK